MSMIPEDLWKMIFVLKQNFDNSQKGYTYSKKYEISKLIINCKKYYTLSKEFKGMSRGMGGI